MTNRIARKLALSLGKIASLESGGCRNEIPLHRHPDSLHRLPHL